MEAAREKIVQALKAQRGVLFFKPMLVGRISYCGRDILAPNSDPAKHGDERGYVLVERWIASKTVAGNDKPKAGEGLSRLIIPGHAEPVCCPTVSYKLIWDRSASVERCCCYCREGAHR